MKRCSPDYNLDNKKEATTLGTTLLKIGEVLFEFLCLIWYRFKKLVVNE